MPGGLGVVQWPPQAVSGCCSIISEKEVILQIDRLKTFSGGLNNVIRYGMKLLFLLLRRDAAECGVEWTDKVSPPHTHTPTTTRPSHSPAVKPAGPYHGMSAGTIGMAEATLGGK